MFNAFRSFLSNFFNRLVPVALSLLAQMITEAVSGKNVVRSVA